MMFTRGCPWYFKGYRSNGDRTIIEVKKLVSNHTCKGVNKCGNFHVSSNWIAMNIKANVQASPNIKPKEIMWLIEQKYQMDVNYDKAWRDREKTRVVF